MPFSRYLRLPSQISVPDELDVVEDSEPEREERRMAEIKKHGKQAKRPRQKPTAIIEVSSDESDPHPAGRSQRDPTNKVDVLDDPILGLNTKQAKGTSEVQSSSQSKTQQKSATDFQRLEDLLRSSAEEHPDIIPRSILDLNRFAFVQPLKPTTVHKATIPLNKAQSSAPPVVTDINSEPNLKLPSKKKATVARRPAYSVDFENLDIANLLKCVCCDLAWTTRKTAVQKIKHIQSCGKKNNWTPDTVRDLIIKELGGTVQQTDEAETQPAPTTLLTEVTKEDVPPKKTRKKQPPVETVKSLATTRNDILARARLLLDNVPPVADSSKTVAGSELSKESSNVQAFGKSKLAARFGGQPLEVQEPDVTKAYDPTMSFPTYPQSDSSRNSSSERCESPPPVRSALAQRFATTRRILNEDLNTEVYAPPSTFPVQPQRLAESSDDDIDDDPGIPVAEPRSTSLHSSRGASDPHHLLRCGVLSPENGATSQRTTRTALDYHQVPEVSPIINTPHDPSPQDYWYRPYDSEATGAYLHYDPDVEFQVGSSRDAKRPTESERHLERPQGPPEKSGLSYTSNLNPNNDPLDSSEIPPPPTKTVKRRGPKKKRLEVTEDDDANSQDIPDEELFMKLRDFILNDVDLHHRVLRYEPVHFDVFLQFALDLRLPSRGLKLRIRAFLDSQAIHFYGLTPTGRRTKQRYG